MADPALLLADRPSRLQGLRDLVVQLCYNDYGGAMPVTGEAHDAVVENTLGVGLVATRPSAYRREVLNSTLNRASGVVIYIVFPSSPPNVKLTNERVPAGAFNEAICLPAGEKTHNPPGPAV